MIDCREILSRLTGLRCLYPFDVSTLDNRIRCLLEEKDCLSANLSSFEDAVVELFSYSKSFEEKFSHALKSLFPELSGVEKLENFIKMLPCHPGITPIYRIIRGSESLILMTPYFKSSLLSLSRFHARTKLLSPSLTRAGGRGARDVRLRFILYQLFQTMAFLHERKLSFSQICTSQLSSRIGVDEDLWLVFPFSSVLGMMTSEDDKVPSPPSENIPLPLDHRETIISRWLRGKVSNFEYLMCVNAAAGRTLGDHLYHPLMPWVTDFTCDVSELCSSRGDSLIDSRTRKLGLRDLSRSKFRLCKGDDQLEVTYRHSTPPHHVPESLSELTYFIYMARRSPMQVLYIPLNYESVLQRVVRDVFVPEHYPSSIARMYEWTPDECIPAFFYDPSVFESLHRNVGLLDLELPGFASTPSEFISYHRRILESPAISSDLHRWIDITFGYCLRGSDAVTNLNVPLGHSLLAGGTRIGDHSDSSAFLGSDKHPGFVSLFDRPHPARHTCIPDPILPNASCSNNNISSYKSSYNTTDSDTNMDQFYLESVAGSDRSRPRSYGKIAAAFRDKGQLSTEATGSSNQMTAASSMILSLAPHCVLPKISDTVMKLDFSALPTEVESHFSHVYGPALEPAYVLPKETNQCVSHSELVALGALRDLTDFSKMHSTENNCFINELVALNVRYKSNCKNRLVQRQSLNELEADLFSAGCLAAELFLGQPLFSTAEIHAINIWVSEQLTIESDTNDDFETSLQRTTSTICRFIFNRTISLPLTLQHLLCTLLLPISNSIPTAAEIVQACTQADFEVKSQPSVFENDSSWRTVESAAIGYVDFSLDEIDRNDDESSPLSPHEICFGPRLDLLSSYCNGLFPSYFRTAYRLIGELKLASHPSDRLRTLSTWSSEIMSIPLEGLHLALPQILYTLSQSDPFKWAEASARQSNDPQTTKESELSSSSFAFQDKAVCSDMERLLKEYSTIIDCVGSRLGQRDTEQLVLPRVISLLTNLNSPDALEILLASQLWSTLSLRAGIEPFLRRILPLLLTYLISGALKVISELSSMETSSSSGTLESVTPQFPVSDPSNNDGNHLNNESFTAGGWVSEKNWVQESFLRRNT